MNFRTGTKARKFTRICIFTILFDRFHLSTMLYLINFCVIQKRFSAIHHQLHWQMFKFYATLRKIIFSENVMQLNQHGNLLCMRTNTRGKCKFNLKLNKHDSRCSTYHWRKLDENFRRIVRDIKDARFLDQRSCS